MLEHLEWCSHVVLILVELGEGLSRNVWQATEVVLGPGSDLEVDVGFEGTRILHRHQCSMEEECWEHSC